MNFVSKRNVFVSAKYLMIAEQDTRMTAVNIFCHAHKNRGVYHRLIQHLPFSRHHLTRDPYFC